MLKTKVLVHNITNLTDARYFAAWMVDWMSFKVDGAGPFDLSLEQITEIMAWVEGVEHLAYFTNMDYNESLLDSLKMSGLILSPFVEKVPNQPEDKLIFKEVLFDDSAIQTQIGHLDYKLILNMTQNKKNWSNLTADDKEKINHFAQVSDIFLDIDFSSNQLDEILDQVDISGIVLRGGQEEKVGYKSFDQLDEIYDALLD